MFKVSILKKDSQVIFEGMVTIVTFPGEDGEITILPFHCPLIVRLKTGVVKVADHEFSIRDGVVRVEDNEVHAIVE